MKKIYIIGIILAVLVVLAGVAGFLLTGNFLDEAEAAHRTAFEQYASLKNNISDARLTIHEDGVVMGNYSLQELGLLTDTMAAADRSFTDMERLEPMAFTELPIKERLLWLRDYAPATHTISLDLTNLDLTGVFSDLNALPRTESQNAYVEFHDGSFLVHEEVPGRELETTAIETAIRETLSTITLTPSASAAVRLELTDTDCYLLPQITVENTFFDFSGMLRDSIQGMTVTVDFHGKTETLDAAQLETILYADEKGKIQVNDEVLKPIVTGWWEAHQESDVPYLFNSYVEGVIPIDFIHVDYEINQEALLEQLHEQLPNLKSLELTAPWYCWRYSEPFAIEGEYIEIDIKNQTMSYFKDDELVVTTPVVTGATWGYPTPPGLYDVDNKQTNCWLSGPDYNVHVDYWLGVIGYDIGIHDADWRTKFGGTNYIKNGSHGCINTPKEATKIIFDSVEVGVPVLVYGK